MKIVTPFLTAALALGPFATPMQAATIDVRPVHSSNVFADRNGENKWYVGTSFMVGTQSINNVAAGVFRVEGEDENGALQDFLAFCLEPLENLILPKQHRIENRFAADVTASLQALAANGWGLVQDRVSAAAFQLAAWEIVTETGSYDIQSGDFKVTGTGKLSNQAEVKAQAWLENIESMDWTAGGFDFMILAADGTQDLLTNVEAPTPMPLPASGLMLLAGLAGAAGFAKRRQN